MLRISDIALAAYVALIAILLIVPVPTFLIDVIIVFNIASGILLLLAGLYVPNAVSLLAFPSILLLTTLLRLSVNVASTRLILTNAYAGQVIHAFGNFLIRGEVVVGLLLFGIISIVTLVVISRGAGRVSEVAARFTLDALPGRQMAIDADLRAGTLSPEQAKQRREELRRESMLYGSMDGAMKFVQGDALAGIAIIFINIFGGIYVGLSKGADLAESIQTYTTLTVGDGLVSQIPALLISICAGIVVTRVSSSGNQSTLGSELSQQLFTSPALLFLTAGVLLVIAVLPGIPSYPFLLFALLFGGIAMLRVRSQSRSQKEFYNYESQTPSRVRLASQLPALPEPDREENDDEEVLVLALDETVLYRKYRQQPAELLSFWKNLADGLFAERGIELPSLQCTSSPLLKPLSAQILCAGSQKGSCTVPVQGIFVESNPANADILGCTVLVESEHPLSGHLCFWTADTLAVRRVLEMGSIRYYEPLQFILLSSIVLFLEHPELCIGISDTHRLLQSLEKKYPGLLSESFQGNFLSTVKLTDVLYTHIKHGGSIRDFKSIAEGVARFCAEQGVTPADDTDVNPLQVVNYIRSQHLTHLKSRFQEKSGALRVCLVEQSEDEHSQAHLDEIKHFYAQQRQRGVGMYAYLLDGSFQSHFLKNIGEPPGIDAFSIEELDVTDKVVAIHEIDA